MSIPLTTIKWTLADYHRMVAAGILAGRQVELLDGEIVAMAPEGEPHGYDLSLGVSRDCHPGATSPGAS